ncbi:MAG TPA: hypothetical protein VJT13_09850 [Xanthobacteraceae bacterium]|nr:hypothetical protein [Xanthobacteraceae bacterium]
MRIGYWQRTLIGAGLGAALVATAVAQQQQQPPMRIRGQIEKVDGNTLTVKARDGAMLTVNVPDNVRVMNFVKASLADIKPNSYIGVTAMPQPDGSQKAIAIHIFLEAQRGTGEGHRPWDLRPGSTMTNAAVETTAGSVDGQVLTVKYKQGDKVDEKKVIVPPDAAIVTYAPADKSELKAGAQIIIFGAQKQADGTLQAQAVNVGRGITPPM